MLLVVTCIEPFLKFMLRFRYVILVAFCYGCAAAMATSQLPESLLHKTYEAQSKFVDSLTSGQQNLTAREMEAFFMPFEKFAEDHKDHQLASILKSGRYRSAIDRQWVDDSMENNIRSLLESCDFIQCRALEADVLQLLADFYWLQKDYVQALENYSQAQLRYKSLSAQDFPHKAEFIHTYGSRYFHFRDYKSAKTIFHELWNNIPSEYISNKISKLNTLGLCYSNLSEYDSAIYYLNEARKYIDPKKDEVWEGIISGNLGNCYYQLGQYELAIPLLEKNIALSEQHNELVDMAFALSTLGEIFLNQKQAKKALEYLTKAHSIVKRKNLFARNTIISKIYIPLGKAYAANGNMVLGYRYLDSGRLAKESIENQRNILQLTGAQQRIELEKYRGELTRKENEIKDKSRFIRNLAVGLATLVLMLIIILWQFQRNAKERKRSDRLLLNILPAETAEELKATGRAKARDYEEVTVLFTDFKDFTRHSEHLDAQELVNQIHQCFSAFDRITESYGIEKIKTIGDSYMCASGLPNQNQHHAVASVDAALEMLQYIEALKNEKQKEGKPYFEVRIGMHSGPVVAGIVGIKKFAYDIWGDTVNIAARMEAASLPGKINISGATYEKIKHQYHCQYRGKIEAKNKGEVDMYFVNVPAATS